jgi:hypothetical protein
LGAVSASILAQANPFQQNNKSRETTSPAHPLGTSGT